MEYRRGRPWQDNGRWCVGAAAYGVVISCVGILEWYLISTSPGRSVPYMCRHTSMVCPSMVSIGLKRARHTGDRSAQMDGNEVVGTCNNQSGGWCGEGGMWRDGAINEVVGTYSTIYNATFNYMENHEEKVRVVMERRWYAPACPKYSIMYPEQWYFWEMWWQRC